MNIDLRKLYALGKLEINEEIIIPEDYYQKMDIIRMSLVRVDGKVFINSSEEIELDANLKGTFILPCAISLEEVEYDFDVVIEEIIDENKINNEISLALLDILWENIVLEVPMKVVKEGINSNNIKGEGWELEENQ